LSRGWSTNRTSPEEAEAAARKYCGATLCDVVLTFRGRCAAYAEGALNPSRPSGTAIRETLKAAEASALMRCEKENGDGSCKIILGKCNKKG